MDGSKSNRSRLEIGSLYSHYKGQRYKIIAIGYHSETLEQCVIYQALYNSLEFGNNAVWIRPLEMFLSTVMIDGKEVQRFTKVE